MSRKKPAPLDLAAEPIASQNSNPAALPRTPQTAFEDTDTTIETYGYNVRTYDPRGHCHRSAVKVPHD
jgi:hypothetical protein